MGIDDSNEEGTGDVDPNEESMVTNSLNGDIALASKQNEDLTDRKKEVLVSHIPMSFEHLRKDMDTVFQITKGGGNVFFKVSVDLGTRLVKMEFCGNTQQKNVTMISTGKGILKLQTGPTSGNRAIHSARKWKSVDKSDF